MSGPPPRLREADLRPDELMAEQARRYAADVARLMKQSARFVEVPCPACASERYRPTWAKYGLQYRLCEGCATTYVSPRPGPELLDEYYRTSSNYEYWNDVVFPASEDARRNHVFRPRAERVVGLVARHGANTRALMDVGAGFGTFCEEVSRLGVFDRVVALEPEPNLARTCRGKGLEVIASTIEATPGDTTVDVVTSFEVIEHLFAPRAFLERCLDFLTPGGLVVITCPNGLGFDIQALGELSATIDAEHLNYFNPSSLGLLMEDAGFEMLEAHTPGQLDAELVRRKVLSGELSLDGQPFLERVLVKEWATLGGSFQDFLVEHGLSSNMWVVARAR